MSNIIETFCAPDDKVAVPFQDIIEFVDYFLFYGVVEVDKDISAKDHIERLAKGDVDKQVKSSESNHFFNILVGIFFAFSIG